MHARFFGDDRWPLPENKSESQNRREGLLRTDKAIASY